MVRGLFDHGTPDISHQEVSSYCEYLMRSPAILLLSSPANYPLSGVDVNRREPTERYCAFRVVRVCLFPYQYSLHPEEFLWPKNSDWKLAFTCHHSAGIRHS